MEYKDIFDKMIGNQLIEKQIVVSSLNSANSILQMDTLTDTESSEYAEYQLKMQWARAVISNPTQAARKMVPAVMTNTDVLVANGEVVDDTIQWIIDDAILKYASIM